MSIICNEELVIKILGKLIIEFSELEVDLQRQLKIKRTIEETVYNYEVTSKETSLVTSDFLIKKIEMENAPFLSLIF